MSDTLQLRYEALVEDANVLMEELQRLASRAVETGVLTEQEFLEFDPYAASEELVVLDNTVIDAGRVTETVLAQAEALVDRLTAESAAFQTQLGESTGDRNRNIALSTVAAGMTALAVVGILAYFSRAKPARRRRR